MRIHFISGFLGSGKTTTIINTAKILMKQGLKVGVVTNDQGRFLVDSHFIHTSGIPSVEVSSGCFCCNYDDFESHVISLADNEKPDIIFAESVGSCADIIATVMKPFMEFRAKYSQLSCLSAFADARMLRARLSGNALPFSDSVIYIFDKQLEEADILIINKSDLLSDKDGAALLEKAMQRFPEKTILLQSAFSRPELTAWFRQADSLSVLNIDKPSMQMDYEQYASGELKLAWFDKVFSISSAQNIPSAVIREMLSGINRKLKDSSTPVGHLKVFADTAASGAFKYSLTGMDAEESNFSYPENPGKEISFVLNARVENSPQFLSDLIKSVLSDVIINNNLIMKEKEENAFKPGKPAPIHRIA